MQKVFNNFLFSDSGSSSNGSERREHLEKQGAEERRYMCCCRLCSSFRLLALLLLFIFRQFSSLPCIQTRSAVIIVKLNKSFLSESFPKKGYHHAILCIVTIIYPSFSAVSTFPPCPGIITVVVSLSSV